MAVTFDAVSRPTPWAESYSWTHSFVDADLIVVVVTQAYGSTPSGVTCDGVALTSFLTMGSVGVGYQTFYFCLSGSWSGDKTIAVNPGDYNTVYAISFKGADNVEPLVEEFALEISSMSARAVSGASENDMYLDCVYSYWDAGGYTPGASQTQRSEWVENTYISGLSTAPGSATSLIETPDTPSSYEFIWYCAVVKALQPFSHESRSSSTVDNIYLEGIFPAKLRSLSYLDEIWPPVGVSEITSSSTVDNVLATISPPAHDAQSVSSIDNITLTEYNTVSVCSFDIPSLSFAALIYAGPDVTLSFDIPTIEWTTEVYHASILSCEFTLPSLSASVNVLTGETIECEFELPLLEMSVATTVNVACDFDIPLLEVSAEVAVGNILTGDFVLPSLGFEAQTASRITAAFTLPSLAMQATAWSQEITCSFVLPSLTMSVVSRTITEDDDTTTLSLNASSGAITTYTNFNFNSYCVFQGKAYGANETGVFLLEGDDDNAEPIPWEVNMGVNDFQVKDLKRVPDIYVTMRGAGTVYVDVTSEAHASTRYELVTQNSADITRNNKIPIGRGHKGRKWEFAVSSDDGMDVQIEEILFNVDVLRRKV